MNLRRGHAEAGVSLVCHEDNASALCGNEVATRDDCLCLHVFLPQEDAGAAGDDFWVVIEIVSDAFPFESAGDFTAVLVNDRADNVGGDIVIELNDELPEIGLEALDTVFRQVGVQMDLLRSHRLRFRHPGDLALLQDLEDGLLRVVPTIGEVDVHSIALQGVLCLLKVLVQMMQGVILDPPRELPKRVRIFVVVEKDSLPLLGAGGGTTDDRGLLLLRDFLRVGVDELMADHGKSRLPLNG